MGIFNILGISLGLLMLNSCGDNALQEEAEIIVSEPSIPSSQVIIHNGVTYTTIVSPYTGNIWLSKNLGAARICTSFNDLACFGDYYQWGRNHDGHEDSTSSISSEQALTINDAGSQFITDSGINKNDWANEDDMSGDKRMLRILSSDGSYICPNGFRIPTAGEFLSETSQASDSVTNNIEAYNNFLKLPSSGLRLGTNGNLRVDNTDAFYMVSGGSYDYGVDYFYYSSDSIGKGGLGARTNGVAVRCIKD